MEWALTTLSFHSLIPNQLSIEGERAQWIVNRKLHRREEKADQWFTRFPEVIFQSSNVRTTRTTTAP